MTEKLARACSRRPWLVVGLWLVVIVSASGLVATLLAFEGETEIRKRPNPRRPTGSSPRAFPARLRAGRRSARSSW
ncbi:hypothetical protein AB0E63_34505 [Kribbella sp. NPDC026596]|uniref:hypothetical protein n=1 Tax=Kribbella sp. NPDC026596 TaxID=3155122 RepID=UPI0033EA1871